MSLVVRVVDVVVLLRCFVLLGWWGPLVDVDDSPGDVDAVGVMVCGVAVSTLGWGPGGWRLWRLFVLASLVLPSVLLLCAGVVVVVVGVL